MNKSQLWLRSQARFSAARSLPQLGPAHPAAGLHGHDFRARCWQPHTQTTPTTLLEQQAQWQRHCQPLDYAHLDQQLACVDDPAIAAHLQQRMLDNQLGVVEIRSHPNQGLIQLDTDRQWAWIRVQFEAAHRLPNVPPGHKCGRMHGHSFSLMIVREYDTTDADPYALMHTAWDAIRDQVQHRCLNHIAGLDNPTSEMLAAWFWPQLQQHVEQLRYVKVFETASCGAGFDGQIHRIWKDMSLDSAVEFPHVNDPDMDWARLHGHTFGLRLQLSAPLDTLYGWAMDFGDVKSCFDPIFRDIDHQPLHRLPGLTDASTPMLLDWIALRARDALPALSRVDLYQEDGMGAIQLWDPAPALALLT